MVLFSTLFPLEIMSLKQRGNRWERSGCIYKCYGVGSTGPQECLAPRNKYDIFGSDFSKETAQRRAFICLMYQNSTAGNWFLY